MNAVTEIAVHDGTKDFILYKVGFTQAFVCTSLVNIDEILRRLNTLHAGGSEAPWQLSEDTNFPNGKPHPCECSQNPETHRHCYFVR